MISNGCVDGRNPAPVDMVSNRNLQLDSKCLTTLGFCIFLSFMRKGRSKPTCPSSKTVSSVTDQQGELNSTPSYTLEDERLEATAITHLAK